MVKINAIIQEIQGNNLCFVSENNNTQIGKLEVYNPEEFQEKQKVIIEIIN